MAYVGNQLSLISSGTLALYGATEGQGGIWWYANTVDSLATVLGANYISDGMKRGMNLGDIVIFFNGSESTLLQVIAVGTTPPFTPGQTTAFGVTLGASAGSAYSTGVAAQYSTAALQSATMTGAELAGADFVLFNNTGTTPGNLQLPSAAALLAAMPDAGAAIPVGFTYVLAIRNSSSGANTATITQDSGATITLPGTNTIAQNTTRFYLVDFTAIGASATATFYSLGLSAAAA